MKHKGKKAIVGVVIAASLGLGGALAGATAAYAVNESISGSGFEVNEWYPWATPRYHDGNILFAFNATSAGCDGIYGGGTLGIGLRDTSGYMFSDETWGGPGWKDLGIFSSRWFYVNSAYWIQGGGCSTGNFTGVLTY